MKSQGILFKSEMIRALLNVQPDVWPAQPIGSAQVWKWQTRRALKPQPKDVPEGYYFDAYNKGRNWNFWTPDNKMANSIAGDRKDSCQWRCPYPADSILYARETFAAHGAFGTDGRIQFRADYPDGCNPSGLPWKPGIHMPRAVARLWFEVMQVRVQRVNAITEADALAEGISWPDRDGQPYRPPIDVTGMSSLRIAADRYAALWEQINGKGSWEKNTWVWAYDLKRITPPKSP